MLCISNASTDIYFNLAAEEYLLKNHQEDIFMLWQSSNAVVVGKHQDLAAEIDRDFVDSRHIRMARRYSGGGAVFQDRGNLNLTFIQTTRHIDFSPYIKGMLHFLSSLGIRAESDQRHGITVDRLKVSGSAQCIYKNRLLYHCTLLYSTDLNTLKASLNGKLSPCQKTSPFVKSVKSEVTNLNRYLTPSPDIAYFRQLLLTYFLKQTETNDISRLSRQDLREIYELRNRKYITEPWIAGRTS